jgi:hypothetical protein
MENLSKRTNITKRIALTLTQVQLIISLSACATDPDEVKLYKVKKYDTRGYGMANAFGSGPYTGPGPNPEILMDRCPKRYTGSWDYQCEVVFMRKYEFVARYKVNPRGEVIPKEW